MTKLAKKNDFHFVTKKLMYYITNSYIDVYEYNTLNMEIT